MVPFTISISQTSFNKLWKAAGKPHNGPIYDQHKSDKLAYKLRDKDKMQRELSCYSNDLHEALSEKLALTFGNAGDLSLGIRMQLPVTLTDWLTNLSSLLNFAEHFANVSRGNSESRCSKLKEEYTEF